jgi:hypothetical protein
MAGILTAAAALLTLGGRLDLGIMNIPAKLSLWTVLPVLMWTTGLVRIDEKAMVKAAICQVCRRAKRLFFAAPETVVSPVAETKEVT